MSGPQLSCRRRGRLARTTGDIPRRVTRRHQQIPMCPEPVRVDLGRLRDPLELQGLAADLALRDVCATLRVCLGDIELAGIFARNIHDVLVAAPPDAEADIGLRWTSIRRRHYGPGGHRRLRWQSPVHGVVWMGAVVDWTHVRAPMRVVTGPRRHEGTIEETSTKLCSGPGSEWCVMHRLSPGHTVTAEGHRVDLIVRPRSTR